MFRKRNLGVRRTSLCIANFKENLQLTITMRSELSTKICTDCKSEKPISEFYRSQSHRLGVMCYCKNCFNKRCVQRWINRKIKAIQYKGSKCHRCQLHLEATHYAVFEFHHADPTTKDVDWTKMRLSSWKKIMQELDKCVLLCANCHRITHVEFLEREGFPEQPKSR